LSLFRPLETKSTTPEVIPGSERILAELRYPTELSQGDEGILLVEVETLSPITVEISFDSPTIVIKPEKAAHRFDSAGKVAKEFVISSQTPGTKHAFVRVVYQKPPGAPVGDSKATLEDAKKGRRLKLADLILAPAQGEQREPMTVEILPLKTFGLTEAQWKAVQIIGGVIGIPSLLAFIAGWLWSRGSPPDKTQRQSEEITGPISDDKHAGP